MKTIARFLMLLFLICGTALALKTNDRRHGTYSGDSSRSKEDKENLEYILQQVHGISYVEQGWSKKDFQAKLEDAFERNDPCAVRDLMLRARDVSPKEFWSSGMYVLFKQLREKSEVLKELFGEPESPIDGVSREGAVSKEARFLNALLFSGQITGKVEGEDPWKRKVGRNSEKAIELLKGLAAADPENGIYSFFLAGALRQSGARKEDVQSALSQAAKAARFDPYYQGVFDELHRSAYSNAATFAWVHTFLETAPVPDYDPVIKYLKYWGNNEEPGKWTAQKLAKKFIELGTQYKLRSQGYQFSHSEYLIGQNLKYTVEGLMSKSWEEYSQKMRQAQEFIAEVPKIVRQSETAIYRDRIQEKPSCSPDSWKSLHAAYRDKKIEQ